MEAFLFSANAILPIFLLMLVGYLLRHFGVLNASFVEQGTKLVFDVGIPCMLFIDVLDSEFSETFDPLMLGIMVGGSVLFLLLLRLIVPCFIKEPKSYTVFIHGAFRANTLVIGLAVINNIAGAPGVAKLVMLVVVLAPLYNVLGPLLLSEADRDAPGHNLWRTLYTNPLLITALASMAGTLVGLKLPAVLYTSIATLGDMALPLSLLTLGASIAVKPANSNLRRALCASLLKVLVLPLIFLPICYALGMRGVNMAVMLVAFGAPSAIATFPMAYQMHADHELASLIIIFTNIISLFTLFGFIYFLRSLGII